MSAAIVLGFNGNCAEHKTHPAIARRTQHTAVIEWVDGRPRSFGRVLEIHCAAGHQYYALNKDELIEDPFSEQEEERILGGTE